MKRNPANIRIKKVKGYKDKRANAQITQAGIIEVCPKTTRGQIAHEEGHYVLGHNLKRIPKTPSIYARQEIDASVYAFKKTGQPKRMKSTMRAIYNDLTHYEYNESSKKAESTMDKIIKRKGTPAHFKKEWESVRKEIKKVQ